MPIPKLSVFEVHKSCLKPQKPGTKIPRNCCLKSSCVGLNGNVQCMKYLFFVGMGGNHFFFFNVFLVSVIFLHFECHSFIYGLNVYVEIGLFNNFQFVSRNTHGLGLYCMK